MRLCSSPGGVKVSTLPGMSVVSGSNPESGLRLLFIFVVFTLCLPLFIDFQAHVHLSVVLCPRPRDLLIPNINRTSTASINYTLDHTSLCLPVSL